MTDLSQGDIPVGKSHWRLAVNLGALLKVWPEISDMLMTDLPALEVFTLKRIFCCGSHPKMFTSNISGKWWYMHVHAPNLYIFIGWKHRSCNPYPSPCPIRLCQEAARSGCRAASGQPRLTESWCLFSISTFDGWYIILTHVYHGPYRWFATFETLIYCMAKMIPFSGVVWGESQNWTRSFWNISQMTRDM